MLAGMKMLKGWNSVEISLTKCTFVWHLTASWVGNLIKSDVGGSKFSAVVGSCFGLLTWSKQNGVD